VTIRKTHRQRGPLCGRRYGVPIQCRLTAIVFLRDAEIGLDARGLSACQADKLPVTFTVAADAIKIRPRRITSF